jgi:hypothetical protein
MERNGNAIGDRFLEGSQIGDDGIEGIVTEMLTKLIEVRLLVGAAFLVAGYDITE